MSHTTGGVAAGGAAAESEGSESEAEEGWGDARARDADDGWSSDDSGFSDEESDEEGEQPAAGARRARTGGRERKYSVADVRGALRYILTTLMVSNRNVGAEAAAVQFGQPTMAWKVEARPSSSLPPLPALG